MEKEHFEILLERIEDNTKLALEGVAAANDRLERIEAGQAEIKKDLREVKSTVGLLHSIANDHEGRLRKLEAALEDHVAEHHAGP